MKKSAESKKSKLKQVEMMPLPHGGKREGAGRKPIDQELKKPETVTIRVKKDLLPEIEKLKNGENKNELKETLLQQIEVIRSHRDKAEQLENKRKGEDYGQFEQILLIEAELNRLKGMIEKI